MSYEPQNMNADPNGSELDSNTILLATLTHLSGLLLGLFGPLIFWLVAKDKHSFLDDQGKEALNFQISIAIYSIASVVLCFVLIGFLLIFAVILFGIIAPIIAAVQVNSGEWYRYPLILRLVK